MSFTYIIIKNEKVADRRLISENLQDIDFGNIKIEEAIEHLQILQEKHKEEYSELRLNLESLYDFGDEHNVPVIEINGIRKETDDEYRVRIDLHKKRQAAAEKRKRTLEIKNKEKDITKKRKDRELFNQLKQKYGW